MNAFPFIVLLRRFKMESSTLQQSENVDLATVLSQRTKHIEHTCDPLTHHSYNNKKLESPEIEYTKIGVLDKDSEYQDLQPFTHTRANSEIVTSGSEIYQELAAHSLYTDIKFGELDEKHEYQDLVKLSHSIHGASCLLEAEPQHLVRNEEKIHENLSCYNNDVAASSNLREVIPVYENQCIFPSSEGTLEVVSDTQNTETHSIRDSNRGYYNLSNFNEERHTYEDAVSTLRVKNSQRNVHSNHLEVGSSCDTGKVFALKKHRFILRKYVVILIILVASIVVMCIIVLLLTFVPHLVSVTSSRRNNN